MAEPRIDDGADEVDEEHVDTRAEKLDTPDAVTIEEPRGIIRGVGLEFDNVAKTAVLNHQVQGTMQPSAAPAKLP